MRTETRLFAIATAAVAADAGANATDPGWPAVPKAVALGADRHDITGNR